MPGGGAKPGERRGGRQKGTPNKRTAERQRVQEYTAEAWKLASSAQEMRAKRKKLGKEIASEFANVFANMAAYHQPIPAGQPIPPNREPNEEKFVMYAELAVWAGAAAAKYESPTYKAITVEAEMVVGAAPPSAPPQPMPVDVTPEPEDRPARQQAAQNFMRRIRGAAAS